MSTPSPAVAETIPDPALVELLMARAGGHARLTDRLVSAWVAAGSIEARRRRYASVLAVGPLPQPETTEITALLADSPGRR